MSKAFTKESDGEEDVPSDLNKSPLDPLPAGAKNYMTPAGAKRLQSELENLAKVERPRIVETIAWAASNGDRSENADYIYGKRRLREIDRRLHFLTKRLDALVVVDPCQQKSTQVLFGATVTVLDEGGKKICYQIVGIDETDPSRGKVSWVSPIGRCLLQAKQGDIVTLRTPKGETDLEILTIEYIPIEA